MNKIISTAEAMTVWRAFSRQRSFERVELSQTGEILRRYSLPIVPYERLLGNVDDDRSIPHNHP